MMEFNDIWAAVIKMAVKQARLIADDQEALAVKSLYKQWDKQIGNKLEVGEYVQYDGKLYRVLQAHTVQLNWVPGESTESMYVVIDKEHAGTKEDPIPYAGNMELFNGKYYEQNGILYLCVRDSGAPLYHELIHLVGSHVETVEVEEVKEATGGKDDPIMYSEGMELFKDKYYTQDNVLYVCVLNSGGPLYYKLSSLVGLYVEVDNANYL